jgi:hypothetical protein
MMSTAVDPSLRIVTPVLMTGRLALLTIRVQVETAGSGSGGKGGPTPRTWRCSAGPSSARPSPCVPGDTEAALAAYEEKLFPRSVSEAADTHVILDLCLGDRAPFGFIDFLSGGADAPQ